MKLPEIQNSKKYIGLYVIDFGDSCAVGYTATETASLLESEKYTNVKVFKIVNARPDGSLELKGMINERFQLESGMFFHCLNSETAIADFDQLSTYADNSTCPCKAKLQLAHDAEGNNILGLIYPAEYEEEISSWMIASRFKGSGAVDAGISQVDSFYNSGYCIDQSKQILPADTIPARSFEELENTIKLEIQRAM